ncbi:MAG TPA: hypothetical protein VGM62_01000, partial [Chthoniobacterales bacterium]
VALVIYALSFRARVFPKNAWVVSLIIMGLLTTAATFFQLWDFVDPKMISAVVVYGIHSNFFHLPLIFIMARVLTFEDVKKFGQWTLLLLIPMTLLMIAQFRAAPDAFVNKTAGGEGQMLMSAMGKVRTAGPFSFITGVVAYFSLATGYIVWAVLKPGMYKTWLLAGASCALIIGAAVSGSRSLIGACAVVVASLLLVVFLRPDVINRFGKVLLAVVVLGFVVSQIPIFREGTKVMFTRFSEVAEATEQSIPKDLVSRVLSPFEEGVFALGVAPLLGYGLGVGTNAGAKLLFGQSFFLLMEGEWPRVILENGPILGVAYLLWRLGFVVRVGWLAVKSVKIGNLLPLLLFGSSFLPMISGQFGQPTTLGFAVFVTGLAVAATQEDISVPVEPQPPDDGKRIPMKPIRGRSIYAERLHGSGPSPKQPNGSVAG